MSRNNQSEIPITAKHHVLHFDIPPKDSTFFLPVMNLISELKTINAPKIWVWHDRRRWAPYLITSTLNGGRLRRGVKWGFSQLITRLRLQERRQNHSFIRVEVSTTVASWQRAADARCLMEQSLSGSTWFSTLFSPPQSPMQLKMLIILFVHFKFYDLFGACNMVEGAPC